MEDSSLLVGGTVIFTIVIIVFSLVVTIVPLILVFKWMSKMKGERQALLANGAPGQARILQLGPTGLTVNDAPEMNLVLEVHPSPSPTYRGGSPPFMVNTKAFVPIYAMARVQPGAMVPVRFNPQNPSQLAIDFRSMGFM